MRSSPLSESNNSNQMGRVEWVNPRSVTNKKTNINNNGTKQHSSNSSLSISNPTYTGQQQAIKSRQQRTNNNNDSKSSPVMLVIDEATCKTICMIVEEYLRELREHQQSINIARAKIRDTHQRRQQHHHHQQQQHSEGSINLTQQQQQQSLRIRLDNNNFIALNDISRLRVRDEQTKAVETIKQLTNYLRELYTIKRQFNYSQTEAAAAAATGDNSSSENISNKLSDLRNDIIQALNDFVLSNGDIDLPQADPDDPLDRERDYDLLMDAQLTRRGHQFDNDEKKEKKKEEEDGNDNVVNLVNRTNGKPLLSVTSFSENKNNNIATTSSTEVIDSYQQSIQQHHDAKENDNKFQDLNKRKCEIQKLERDTIELRRLFADFYNLVRTQNESVDSIENNIMATTTHIHETNNHLINANESAFKVLPLLIPVTGCITGALIGGPIGLIVGGKLGGVTIVCATTLIGLLSSISVRKCMR